MNGLVLAAQGVINDATQIANTPVQADIIGLGGILATIIVGIITCWVTWILTMRSIKQLKLSYSIKYYPILSNAINMQNPSHADGFKIQYKNKSLENPCLLAVDIENIGNSSIENPPIKICTTEDIQIIPGYFEDIPIGYDEIWNMESDAQNSCKLLLKHINPKQTAHVRFYLNKQPNKELSFECPMPDLQLQKSGINNNAQSVVNIKSGPYTKINIVLAVIVILLFISIDSWNKYIGDLIWVTEANVSSMMTILYILAVLVISLILNLCRPRKTTLLIKQHKLIMGLVSLSMALVSFILLYLIVFDIIIIYRTPQIVAAIASLIMLPISIHILSMMGEGGNN